MPFATVSDGVRLYYEELGAIGTGEPLLLISGQGSDHTSWIGVRDDFAARYHVIVYDHRGTGQSDKPTEPPYSTRGFAQDAIDLLDSLHIQRTHAYGVSMGGRICQWLGIDHADRIGSLVLGCTTPGNAHGIPRSAEVNARMANGGSNSQADMLAMLQTVFTPEWIRQNAVMLAQATPPPIPDYAQRLHYFASEGHDTWDLLPTIQASTLVIHGSDDLVNPTGNAYLLAERIPHAELAIIEGGRHGYFIEFREEADRIVNDFLARHPL
jgi:pimeloyl-ACP methyl ester carboxylesterase